MSATTLTALTVLVGLLGGLIYWWGEKSAFPWMKFGAAAILVVGIGVAAVTWPDHHVVAQAGNTGSASSSPSLSPSTVAPFGPGSSLARSSQVSGQAATADAAPQDFSGSIVVLTGGSGGPPPPPTPKPSHTPSQTPSPSPSESETPSPSPSESETPSPTPTESETPSPSPSESETPSPTPTESETPSPTPSESETPSPTPSEPSPSPSALPMPNPAPTSGLRLL